MASKSGLRRRKHESHGDAALRALAERVVTRVVAGMSDDEVADGLRRLVEAGDPFDFGDDDCADGPVRS